MSDDNEDQPKNQENTKSTENNDVDSTEKDKTPPKVFKTDKLINLGEASKKKKDKEEKED